MPRRTPGHLNICLIWPEKAWPRVKAAAAKAGLDVWLFVVKATMREVTHWEKEAATGVEPAAAQSTTPRGSTL